MHQKMQQEMLQIITNVHVWMFTHANLFGETSWLFFDGFMAPKTDKNIQICTDFILQATDGSSTLTAPPAWPRAPPPAPLPFPAL